ncbi:hypothetical protein NL676_030612 [Syzygium grande]|nr:hypothetical protein NL676_030612 [Syzygium grande]
MAIVMDNCLSNDDALEEATASFEYGSNDLSIYSIRCRNHRIGYIEAMTLSQPDSVGIAIGDEDEVHSTSGTNIDRKELESDPRVPRVGMEFDSEVALTKNFLCSIQGHESKERMAKVMPYKRRDTRTGCDARIECVVNDGTWKISEVVHKHNHATTALSMGRIVNEVRAVGERALVSDA